MDSTQDKQTDVAGRAGELRERYMHEIEYVLNDDTTGEVRVTYGDGHSEIKDAKVLLLDDIMRLVDGYTRELLDSATRTAVTEALDKVADEVIGQNETASTEVVGNSRPNHNYRNNRNHLRDEQRQRLEALRTVIAAGGKQ